MPNKKINDLPLFGSITDNIQFEGDISGSTEGKANALQLKNYVLASVPSVLPPASTLVFIGTGGDYATVKDATDASETYMELISDVTEESAITLPAEHVFLRIPPAITWDCETNNTKIAITSDSTTFHITGEGTITWAAALTGDSFVSAVGFPDAVFKMSHIDFANNSIVNDCTLAEEAFTILDIVRASVPNQDTCLLDLENSGCVVNGLVISGNGSSCSNLIKHSGSFGSFENVFFFGTYSTTTNIMNVDSDSSIYDRVYIITGSGPFKIDATGSFKNIFDVLDVGVQIATNDLDFTVVENFNSPTNGILNINRQFIIIQNVIVNQITTSNANALKMINATATLPVTLNANRAVLDKCEFNDVFNVNGERNKITNCNLLDNVNVSATSSSTRFQLCRMGNPGGSETVTIASGANNTSITSCDITDLSNIVDNGTNTSLSDVGVL